MEASVTGVGAVVALPPPPPSAPMRLHSGIKPPRKVADVPPVYPAIARSAHVQGVVILEAVIDAQGGVASVRVLRSIPLLDQSGRLGRRPAMALHARAPQQPGGACRDDGDRQLHAAVIADDTPAKPFDGVAEWAAAARSAGLQACKRPPGSPEALRYI
jgi:hypothetical protein